MATPDAMIREVLGVLRRHLDDRSILVVLDDLLPVVDPTQRAMIRALAAAIRRSDGP